MNTNGHRPHYDSIAEAYALPRQKHFANRQYLQFLARELLRFTPADLSLATVLDCMCGSCDISGPMIPHVGSLHGVDISTGILRQIAPEHLPGLRVCADAHHLPYARAVFDAVFISGGLHHVPDTFETVLQEIYRIMKPGGWLICFEAADDNPLVYLARQLLHRMSSLYEDGERGFSAAELKLALERTGFTQIAVQRSGYAAYTLIGNTDVLPLFAGLKNQTVINALLTIDRYSPRIPLWNTLGAGLMIRGQVAR